MSGTAQMDLAGVPGSRRITAADFAREYAAPVKERMLANQIIYQEQTSTGIIFWHAMLNTVFNLSFAGIFITASILAYSLSHDSTNIIPENRDTAFIAIFMSIMFTLTVTLYVEEFISLANVSIIRASEYVSHTPLTYMFDLFTAILSWIQSWLMFARVNFFITGVSLFATHSLTEDEVRSFSSDILGRNQNKLNTLLAPSFDMRYVRPSSILDPYSKKQKTNIVAVMASFYGMYKNPDGGYRDIFSDSSKQTSDANLVMVPKSGLFTTENIAGKYLRYIESFSPSIGDGVGIQIYWFFMAFASGAIMSDTLYRYAIENAFLYLPQRTRVHNPFKVY